MAQQGSSDSYHTYQGTDGKFYQNETDASNYGAAHKGGGGGAMGGMAGGFLLIFIIGPIIAAKLIGWLWGLLLKLGFVGKIITTALMVVAGPIIVFTPLFMAKELSRSIPETVQAILLLGSVFMLPTWYYFWHYDTVKEMGASVFSNKIKNFTMFSWFGFIGGWIIGAISKGNTNTVAGVIFLIATVAGIIYYLLSTISYAREVERTKSFRFRWIGLAVSAGLVVLGIFAAQAFVTVRSANVAAELKKNMPEAVWVYTSELRLFAEPDEKSEVLKVLVWGQKLVPIDVTSKGGKEWFAIEVDGQKGWVREGYTRDYDFTPEYEKYRE